MKLRNLVLACSLTLPFVATSAQNHSSATLQAPQIKLDKKEQTQAQKEKDLIRQSVFPCKPFPKCAD